MAVIGSLSVKLGLVTVDWDKATAEAKRKAVELRGAVSDLTGGITNLGQVFKNLGGSMGLSIAGIAALTKSTMGWAGQINDLSVSYDVSISKILQFQSAIVAAGGKTEDAQKILATMFDKISSAQQGNEQAVQTFKALGITLNDLQNTAPDEMIAKVYKGIAGIGNTYDRIALVKDVLGKSGVGKSITEIADALGQSDAAFQQQAASIKALDDLGDSLAKTYDNLRLALADVIAPFTGSTGGEALANINSIKAAMAGLASAVIVGKLIEIANVSAKIIQVWREGAKIQAALTALQGFKGMAMLAAGGAAYYAASKFLEGSEAPTISAAPTAPANVEKSIKNLIAPKTKAKTLADILPEVTVTAETKRDTSEYSEFLSLQSSTSLIKAQLGFEKERLQLKNDSYMLTEKEQKIAELELNRRQQVNQLQQQLNDLEWSTDKESVKKAKAEQIQAQIEMVNQLAEAEKNLANVEEERRQSFEFGWKQAFFAYAEDAKNSAQVGGDVFNSVVGNMGSAIDNFVQTGKFSFKDFANSVIQDILRIMLRWQMMQIVMGVMGAFGKGGMGGNNLGNMDLTVPSLPTVTMPGHAAGGYVDRPSIVGENGKELFIPNRPGTIIPNARMGDFMGQQQPQMVINGTYVANMQAIDTQSATQFLAQNRNAVFAANQSAMRGLPAGR
jgi:lambda family phage tail tape measure protein